MVAAILECSASNDRKKIGIFPQINWVSFSDIFAHWNDIKTPTLIHTPLHGLIMGIDCNTNHICRHNFWKTQNNDNPEEATTHKEVSDFCHGRFKGQCVNWHYSARPDWWQCNTNHHQDESLQPLTPNDEYSISPTFGHIVINCIEIGLTETICFAIPAV